MIGDDRTSGERCASLAASPISTGQVCRLLNDGRLNAPPLRADRALRRIGRLSRGEAYASRRTRSAAPSSRLPGTTAEVLAMRTRSFRSDGCSGIGSHSIVTAPRNAQRRRTIRPRRSPRASAQVLDPLLRAKRDRLYGRKRRRVKFATLTSRSTPSSKVTCRWPSTSSDSTGFECALRAGTCTQRVST